MKYFVKSSVNLFVRLRALIHHSTVVWNRFWFEANGNEQMRLFRRALAMLLFLSYLIRSLDLELYYSDLGVAPLSILPDIADLRFRYSLLTLFPGVKALWMMNGIFLVSLLFLALGLMTRFSAILAFVLHLSFLHRNPGSVYGADTVAVFFLAYFCLADFRERSEIQRLQKTDHQQDIRSIIGSVAYRLCQIQLCIIYTYAGLHKLKGVHWWNGEAVWAVLANSQMARWDFSWVSHYPLLFILPTYATLIFEVYFPVLVWVPALRKPLLFYGVLLHLGIGLAMNIPIFAALMVFSYALFLDEATAEKWNAWLERLLILPSRLTPSFGNAPRIDIQKERGVYGETGSHWNSGG